MINKSREVRYSPNNGLLHGHSTASQRSHESVIEDFHAWELKSLRCLLYSRWQSFSCLCV